MSFDTSCAVSHAPIREGDKVRLFFLVSDTFSYQFDPLRDSIGKGHKCYVWDDYKILGGVSIKASYNDYGRYSFDEEGLAASYIHHLIVSKYQENLPEKGREYNPIHDHMNVNKNKLTWSKIQEMIHSGRLFLKSFGEGNLPFVSVFAVHESIYQVMINEVISENGIKKEIEEDLGDIVIRSAEINKKYRELYIPQCEEKNLNEEETEEVINELVKSALSNLKFNDNKKRNYSNQAIDGIDDSFVGVRQYYYKEYDGKEALDLSNILRNIIEVDKFIISMQFANKMIRPTMSSNSDLRKNVDLLRKMAKAIECIDSNKEDDEEHIIKSIIKQKAWKECNFTDLKKLVYDAYGDFDDEEYLYFESMIKDKDKIIIKPEDWYGKYKDYYDYLEDWFSDEDKNMELHILNQ